MNKTSQPSGPGPTRRYPGRSASRAAPYSSSPSRGPESQWDHGMFTSGPAFPARVSSIETGTKLLVSNLHFEVIDEDIEDLFSGIGELRVVQFIMIGVEDQRVLQRLCFVDVEM
ncbi:THO complex subunit 4a [Phtheirospermum japonicum]|uniref:THO complex subunit 4a n=1 Tax=Phtheirospermum japonicum TaxID=374723 RepID=A0A830DDR0_9LAMI|nr:THO complex subunit 4a [Phtheirospermum japonicum]